MVSVSVWIFRVVLVGIVGALVWFFLVPMVREMYDKWATENGYKKNKKPDQRELVSKPIRLIGVDNSDVKEKIIEDLCDLKGLSVKHFKDISKILDRRLK